MAMDETLLIQLSAYADGEADAATVRALEERLAHEPELQRALAKFLALDMAAQRETIPAIPSLKNEAELLRTAREALTPAETKLEVAARAMPVPAVSDEKFGAAWMAIARRIENDRKIKDVMALDDGECETPQTIAPEYNTFRRTWQILDKAAQRIEAPNLDAERSAEAWQTITCETVAVSEQNGAWVEQLDAAARAMIVPQPAAERYSAIWKNVAATLAKNTNADVVAADAVPAVSEQKWDKVWSEVQRQTTGVQKSVIPVDFTPVKKTVGWRWGVVAATSLAAAVVTLVLMMGPNKNESQVAMLNQTVTLPAVADERYELDLLKLPGQSQPVVTMFLKDEPTGSFRWMPE